MKLQQLLQRPDVWRGNQAPPVPGIPTGFPVLDRLLPGGGWPAGALTEIHLPYAGIGELRLLLPALAALSRGERWIVFVASPYIPFAPAVSAAGFVLARMLQVQPESSANALWSVESCLRSGACAAVIAWTDGVTAAELRRWQLAAEAGQTWGVWFQRRHVPGSPASLRLELAPASGNALMLNILKRRGGWPIGPVRVEMDHALASGTPAGLFARDSEPRRA
ncbi:MAG: translesion DNA synthesis-associated protein ImuA [Sulfurifustis sp.]